MDSPAVFLDRDGTIIEDVHYLSNLDSIEWIEGSEKAIRLLKDAGYKVIVITNQSGVARGIFKEDFPDEVHEEMNNHLLQYGTVIDAFYVCPHHPEIGPPQYRKRCSCRKPEPGLILRASQEHGICLEKSFFIGDNVTDMEAAQNAGVQPILVLTGKGMTTKKVVEKMPHLSSRLKVFPSLLDAALWIWTKKVLKEK